MIAFDKLAAIVGAFTRHMADVNTNLVEVQEYEEIYRYMQTCKLLNDAGKRCVCVFFCFSSL